MREEVPELKRESTLNLMTGVVTENSNRVILNGARRSEESSFWAGWDTRFFVPVKAGLRMTILTGSE